MTPAHADDDTLLAAWRGGDASAGNLLVRRHFDALFRFFRARVDDGVADLVQQTFEACVASAVRIPASASFRAWLFGIARNKLLMRQRGSARQRDRPEPDALDHALDDASLGGMIQARAEQRLLLRGLRRLALDLQIALVLSYWEDLSGAEIAEVLEVPLGTIKTRIRRAKEELRATIATLAGDSDSATVTVDDLDRWAQALRDRLVRAP